VQLRGDAGVWFGGGGQVKMLIEDRNTPYGAR
jgi:hypothetical protein